MTESALGQITSASSIQDGIIAHLKLWLPTYLCEVDEQEGYDKGFTAWPRSWQRVPKNNNTLDLQLPAIIAICPGTTGKPTKEGDGYYRASYPVGVSALVKGADQMSSSDISKRYGAAIHTAIMQLKGRINVKLHAAAWDGESFDDISLDSQRTLASVVEHFTIEVSKVFSDKLGPDAPVSGSPTPPPPKEPKEATFPPGPVIPDEEHISVTITPRES